MTSAALKREYLAALEEKSRRQRTQGLIRTLYPDSGPLRRELYQQHQRFFAAGPSHAARLALCANGVGKTVGMGGYETALHLTGLYPDWWPGIRYERPVRWWVAGKTKETVRDNQQAVLLGPVNKESEGGGLLPFDSIDMGSLRRRSQGGGAVDYCRIKHASGGWSRLAFKSYDQKLDAFFGENLDGAWMDEPGPINIFSEIMARFRGSQHQCMMVTFTPKALTAEAHQLVLLFTDEEDPSRAVIPCGWDDVPHLTESDKQNILSNTPPHLKDTVSKGVLAQGVGAVYPVPEGHFVIDPLKTIPKHWRRAFALDPGWHHTAVVWGAWDKDSDTWYLYSEHKKGEMAVPLHAAAIRARGDWIPGVGDYGTNISDGKAILDEYAESGVDVDQADKAGKDARIQAVLTRLLTGRLKVFSTLTEWLREYRAYHYDDKQKIVKVNDHLMNTTEYLMDKGPDIAVSEEIAKAKDRIYVPETKFGIRY